ncbi:MAG: hypothetical protein U0599_01105 [Vicinamibacteria bacterium]
MNFWSSPKADMEKQADGFWTITTHSPPGLHCYTIVVDGVEMNDPGSHAFFGGASARERRRVAEPGADYCAIRPVPHGQVREVWYDSKVTGTWRHAMVYLPPQYEKDRRRASRPLPAWHGGGGQDGWIRQGRAKTSSSTT